MSKSQQKRCILGCYDMGAYMHRFPHPERRSELYKRWIPIVGKKLSEMDPLTVYNNKRICDYHFKTEHKTSGHRLIFTAVPSLYLNGVTKSPNISVQLEHNYCIPRMYKNVPVADIPTEKMPSHLVDYKKVLDLENMLYDQLVSLIESIDDFQAENSDIGWELDPEYGTIFERHVREISGCRIVYSVTGY